MLFRCLLRPNRRRSWRMRINLLHYFNRNRPLAQSEASSEQYFSSFQETYPPAFFLTVAFIFQIISFCFLGTIIDLSVGRFWMEMKAFYKQKEDYSQNSGVLDSVAKCDWYKMKTRERKMYVFLLHNCQHPCVLSVGGYADLNMSTCLAVRVRCH